MAFADRLKLIKKIEKARGSRVVCYLTSLRPNVGAQIADDAVRVLFNHVLKFEKRPVPVLDLFLCSNGGASTVPWRIISLLREFAEKVNVLIPYKAYSAATLIAIGADEIVMHPFGEMGPIDPTVTNEFNPIDPQTNRKLGISVEDVKAYLGFIKKTVGITHEDELIKAIEILAQKVHPLALGNVERFLSQSRLIARKIIRTHMVDGVSDHQIDDIIENLASKLYFHGHPINRKEARDELKLKVIDPSKEVEDLMWRLYLEYEQLFKNTEPYDALGALYAAHTPAPIAFQTPQPIVPVPVLMPGVTVTLDIELAAVETTELSSLATQKRRYLVSSLTPTFDPAIREDALSFKWVQEAAPQPRTPAAPSS